MSELSSSLWEPVERRGLILLRCPLCCREKHICRSTYDYTDAVTLEIVCPDCDDGDFHEPLYYDAEGACIIRDPGVNHEQILRMACQ